MQRLLAELASLPPTSGHVTWKETRSLPYLDACIKEAGRLHPPFGLPLERVVPAGGTTICGQHIRGGTVVGMNAWVIHRDKNLFGEDAAEWRPERWLCGDLEKRKRMEAGLLTVGLFKFPSISVLFSRTAKTDFQYFSRVVRLNIGAITSFAHRFVLRNSH